VCAVLFLAQQSQGVTVFETIGANHFKTAIIWLLCSVDDHKCVKDVVEFLLLWYETLVSMVDSQTRGCKRHGWNWSTGVCSL